MTQPIGKNIYQRILAIMAEVEYVQKENKKVNNQYSYVAHDAVACKLHPQLVKHGVVFVPDFIETKQDGNRTEVVMNAKFINADNPQDFIEFKSFGYGIDTGDKGPGKAMSYAAKYALLKMFLLETGDDPEQDAETKHKPKPIS